MMATHKELIEIINTEFAIVLPEEISGEQLRESLSRYINELIQTNFQKLVALLYRIDVSESKLKMLLQENKGVDAGKIIADLIIERQIQKLKARKNFDQSNKNIDENEKW